MQWELEGGTTIHVHNGPERIETGGDLEMLARTTGFFTNLSSPQDKR